MHHCPQLAFAGDSHNCRKNCRRICAYNGFPFCESPRLVKQHVAAFSSHLGGGERVHVSSINSRVHSKQRADLKRLASFKQNSVFCTNSCSDLEKRRHANICEAQKTCSCPLTNHNGGRSCQPKRARTRYDSDRNRKEKGK